MRLVERVEWAFIAFLFAAAVLLAGHARADEDDNPAIFFARYRAGSVIKSHLTTDHVAGVGKMVRASWYGGGERLNRHTATGEVFRPMGLTAAHRTLPLGTRLQVCLTTCIVVRVNDRGPAIWTGRALDLSRGAATALGFHRAGEARVSMAVL